MPNKGKLHKALKKKEKFRICKEPRKSYGELNEKLEESLKLPAIAQILGSYHYHCKLDYLIFKKCLIIIIIMIIFSPTSSTRW